MPLPERASRIRVAPDDHRPLADAGLTLPVTLARHLGVGEPVDRRCTRVHGHANPHAYPF